MEDSAKANELRKSGDIDSALPMYRALWEASQDKFAAAGLLYCLRKKKMFDEALALAEEVYSKFPEFDWSKNEYIWILIQGKLYTFPQNGLLIDMVALVNKVLKLNPDEIAYKITVFKLLKTAKYHGDWNLLNEWITKLSPDILTGYTDEETGWTDKVLWYYYRVNGLIYSHNENEAVRVIDENCGKFYKQKKYFERLKAKALISLEKFEDALEVYKILVTGRSDWWLLHEYGGLLVKQKKVDEGFSYLIKAAIAPPMKPELKVTLFADIGSLLVQYKQPEQAIQHFKLAKAVREEQGWGLSDLNEKITSLGGNVIDQTDIRILIRNCQEIWNGFLTNDELSSLRNNKSTKGQTGHVTSLVKGRPFCFIKTQDNQSYFCSTADLPSKTQVNEIVKFDVKPSFDKKKNIETLKAINIRRV
ncbi:MAG: tetratricopeptide repeat protein [Flavobacteriaceae bacterium]